MWFSLSDAADHIALLYPVALTDLDITQAAVDTDRVVDGNLNGLAEELVVSNLGDLAAAHREDVVAQISREIRSEVRLPDIEGFEINAVLAVGTNYLAASDRIAQAEVGGEHCLESVGGWQGDLGQSLGRFLKRDRRRGYGDGHARDSLIDLLRVGRRCAELRGGVDNRVVCGIDSHADGYQTYRERGVKADFAL